MNEQEESVLKKHHPNADCLQKILNQRTFNLSLIKSRLKNVNAACGNLYGLSAITADIEEIKKGGITFEFMKRNLILHGESLTKNVLRNRGRTIISPIVCFEDAVFVCDRYLDLQYESVVRLQINDKLGVDHFFIGIKDKNPVACWNEYAKHLVIYEFHYTLADRLLYANFPVKYAENVVCVWKKGIGLQCLPTEKKGTEKE